MKIAIFIPILNPGAEFGKLADALASQIACTAQILLIDSSPVPNASTVNLPSSFQIKTIDKKEFNHGGTRRMALQILGGQDLVLFTTQDVLPADSRAVANLIACFEDEKVGAVFGRQLPRNEANPVEAHARLFNYPAESRVKSSADISTLGVKTAFISNSFAAYRRSALEAVGGFPERCIVSEDTYVAAKMLLAGWKIAYCAEAQVYHSHNYNWRQEFQRYFDIGVFHAREPWVRREFGGAEGEGVRFVKSEIRYLAGRAPHLIPSALIRTMTKYLGFRAGLCEGHLPLRLKRRLSMQKAFWDQEGK